jgi:hypothetical protein
MKDDNHAITSAQDGRPGESLRISVRLFFAVLR